ncbi:MAG: glycosyltransferase [Armatimonadetes bacterium]|nr:glycosyltransferase [Armatimonadota bacterium]
MNRALLEHGGDADLVFIGKGNFIRPETLRALRGKGAQVAVWYGDIRPEPEPWLVELLGEVDVFFMTSGGEMLRRHKEMSGCGRAAYFFNPTDPELPVKYSYLPRGTQNVVWTGTMHDVAQTERRQTLEYLQTRADVAFYGFERPRSALARLARRVQRKIRPKGPPLVRGEAYITAIKSAKIGVGVSALQNVTRYSSDRISHYLTFGTFYLAWRFPEAERLFEPGTELVTFDSVGELHRKIEYFLANPQEREAIAWAAQKRALEQYNTRAVTKMMLDILQKGRSGVFEWEEVL